MKSKNQVKKVSGKKVLGAGKLTTASWAGRSPSKVAAYDNEGRMGNTEVNYFPMRWQSPLMSFVNFSIPFDRPTLYQFIRYWDTFDPVVGNALDLHVQLMLSRFALRGIKDPYISKFYDELMDSMDAYSLMYDQCRERWLLGECFTLLYWDDNIGSFVDGEILMPEYIEVKGHPLIEGGDSLYRYELLPDPLLEEFLSSEDETVVKLKQHLPKSLLQGLEGKQQIVLDPFYISAVMRKQSRYNLRGTSILLRVFKDLLYLDKIREAMYVVADRFAVPREIWKIGNDNLLATNEMIEEFTNLIQSAESQPAFNLITNHAVSYDLVGVSSSYPQFSQDFEWVTNRILTGLFTNKTLTSGGENSSYQSSSIGVRALMMRLLPARLELEKAWIKDIFTPVALKNEFFKITEAELSHGVRTGYKNKELLLPQFDWRYKSNKLDDNQYKQMIQQLYTDGTLPFKVLSDALDLDYSYVEEWKEYERGTVFNKQYENWESNLKKSGIDPSKIDLPPSLQFSKELKNANSDGEAFEIIKNYNPHNGNKPSNPPGRPPKDYIEDDLDIELREERREELLEQGKTNEEINKHDYKKLSPDDLNKKIQTILKGMTESEKDSNAIVNMAKEIKHGNKIYMGTRGGIKRKQRALTKIKKLLDVCDVVSETLNL